MGRQTVTPSQLSSWAILSIRVDTRHRIRFPPKKITSNFTSVQSILHAELD